MGRKHSQTRNSYQDVQQRKLPAYLLRLCREFRKHPTRTEEILWTCLRNGRLHNLKFRRQHPIGRYIADFCCSDKKLIIEIDGAVHMGHEQIVYDTVREKELGVQGYSVIRVNSSDVSRNLRAVLQRIADVAAGTAPLTPGPSPRGRGEEELRE